MGLREMLERSALSARLMRNDRREPARDAASSTPTPSSEAWTPPLQQQSRQPKSSTTSSSSRSGSNQTKTAAHTPAVDTARLTQLVGENPPPGSLARVVKRKYQSVARERERVDMVESSAEDVLSDASSAAGATLMLKHGTLLDAVEQYEVEFPKTETSSLGIELETDFYGKHTVVKHVRRGSIAFALSKDFMRPGHVVVGVNGRDLSHLSFAQVLHELKSAASAPRVIRFVNPSVLSMKSFQFESALVNRDQYGFAKDDKYILSYRKQLRKRKSMSYQHERKWAEFVQRHGGLDALDDSMNSPSEPEHADAAASLRQEFRTLVLSGIPVVLRPRIWSILAGVSRYKKKFGALYFQQLVLDRETSPSVADIEKDVYRTYPEHAFFQTERGKAELKNVLCAYSLHNPSVGYCQSMNFIAGMMLLFMSEEDAFWLLCVMLHKKYLPAENYTQSMLGTQADQLVFKWLVARELPEVTKRLELCGIQIQLVTLHWFLCAFVCTLPTESALRIWDWFFLDGEQVLFTVAIGILKLAEDKILRATTHSDLHTIVRGLGTDLHDEDELMRVLLLTRSISDSDDRQPGADSSPRRRESQRSVASNVFKQPHTSSKDTARSLLQQLLQSLDTDQSGKGSSDPKHRMQFTMRDIEQKRGEYRQQIEAKAPPASASSLTLRSDTQ